MVWRCYLFRRFDLIMFLLTFFISITLSYQTNVVFGSDRLRSFSLTHFAGNSVKSSISSQHSPCVGIYETDSAHPPFRMLCRNVPGDGACLFNALAACLTYNGCRRHLDFDEKLVRLASTLRVTAVRALRQENITLILDEGDDGELNQITTTELLRLASEQANSTGEEYCARMLKPNAWGGGENIYFCFIFPTPPNWTVLGLSS